MEGRKAFRNRRGERKRIWLRGNATESSSASATNEVFVLRYAAQREKEDRPMIARKLESKEKREEKEKLLEGGQSRGSSATNKQTH